MNQVIQSIFAAVAGSILVEKAVGMPQEVALAHAETFFRDEAVFREASLATWGEHADEYLADAEQLRSLIRTMVLELIAAIYADPTPAGP